MVREVSFDSLTCFYYVQDVDSSVLDDQGYLVKPGDSSCRSIVLSAANGVSELSILSIGDNRVRSSDLMITEPSLLTPCVRVNGHTSFIRA